MWNEQHVNWLLRNSCHSAADVLYCQFFWNLEKWSKIYSEIRRTRNFSSSANAADVSFIADEESTTGQMAIPSHLEQWTSLSTSTISFPQELSRKPDHSQAHNWSWLQHQAVLSWHNACHADFLPLITRRMRSDSNILCIVSQDQKGAEHATILLGQAFWITT